jgi:integrase
MGRIYKPKYSVKGPNGETIVKETDAFHIEYTDSSGRTRRKKAGLTAGAAKDALRQAEADVLAEKNGLPTRKAGELVLKELQTAFLQALKQRATPRHVSNVEAAIENVLSETRSAFLKDLKPERMEGFLAGLQSAGRLSARSMNTPLIAVKSMLNWAVQTRRIPYNPLACVRATTGAKTRKRRALSEKEIAALLAAALDGPTRRATRKRQNRPKKDGTFKRVAIPLRIQAQLASDGRNAALAYRLMLEAGLRLNETRCLKWTDLDFSAKTISLRAETTKNRSAATLPIAPGLLAALEARRKELKPDAAAPVVVITSRILKAFNNDLEAAGIEKKDAAGRTVDLHALRHSFGSRLMRNGTDLKSIQGLMRHSTAAMTLGVYVHKDTAQMAAAVEGLADLAAAEVETPAAWRTGTDDRDEGPDDNPGNGTNPPRDRQESFSNSHKAQCHNVFEKSAVMLDKLRVTGSNPVSPILQRLLQTFALAIISGGFVIIHPCDDRESS